MPIRPVSRAYVTRAAVVATSAAAVLLTVHPAGGATATDAAPAALAGTPTRSGPTQAALFEAATAPSATVEAVPTLGSPTLSAPAVETAPVESAPLVEAPVVEAPVETVAASSSAGQTAVANAMSKLGAPYKWGGNGPSSFDCSGLVNWAFEGTGVELPRTSRALSQVGEPVSRDNLQPGDLVFFYSPVSHVGIYIGDGQMVNASNSSKPVEVASIEGREFNSARRVA